MKTPFIVIALAGGKFVCPPMMIAADSHTVAINLAGGCLAEQLEAIPEGTVLHSFNTETDVSYVGDIELDESAVPNQCAGIVESLDISESDRDRVYRPDELYFAVIPYPEEDSCSFVAFLTTKDYWKSNRHCPGFLGDRNLDQDVRLNIGLAEVQEDVFEFTTLYLTESELVGRMIEAGFGYSDAFVKWAKRV